MPTDCPDPGLPTSLDGVAGTGTAASTADLTGRDRMACNVVASWAGHMVFVVAGFILPRFLDRHLGQEALGVWDFAWSLASYFGLAQIGIGSSVNRYVARYRAVGDVTGVNRAVSSVMLVQMASAGVAAVLGALTALMLPHVFGARLAGHVAECQWVVLLLGAGVAFQLLCNPFVGVITGCHRWDIHNGINAGAHLVSFAAMLIVLLGAGGLRGLAVASLFGVVTGEIVRVILGHRVCPELRIRLSEARWSQIVEMTVFGGKTMLNSVARLLLYQTNSMVIAAYLGPGALALYSRPRALVSHAQTLINKFGFVLSPMASSLQASNRPEEIRNLLLQSSRGAAFLALPMVLCLTILGDPILRVWMGPRYEQGLVLAILAIGHVTEMTRQPAVNILAGMNLHGRLALVNLFVGLVSVLLGLLVVGHLGWGLVGAALSVAIPLSLVNGLYVPVYACRRIGIPVLEYLIQANRSPLLCAVPFGMCLLGARLVFRESALLAIGVGVTVGGMVLAFLCRRALRGRRRPIAASVSIGGKARAVATVRQARANVAKGVGEIA